MGGAPASPWTVEDARGLAHELLAAALPQRWRHVASVAAEAERCAGLLAPDEGRLLVCAAWLHDIGYSPAIDRTGVHALDGARHLRELGVERRLCALVAHHSAALIEAELSGRAEEVLREFPAEASPTADLLWLIDLTIGPDGQRMRVEQRLEEVAERYGPTSVVSTAMNRARPSITAAVLRAERLLSVDPRRGVVEGGALDATADVGVNVKSVELVRTDPSDLS